MAHKTLLIGLGSKGSDMVSRAVERVFEHHGGLEETPWLKVLAIDTAPISGESGHEAWRMASTGNVVNIGLDGQQYAMFLGNGNDMAEIDFPRWASKEVFSQAGATHDGAGGVRMIGRGSFLHSGSLARVHSAIQTRLQALSNVNLVQELQERKLPGLPQGSDPNAIRIFVCGALTGGTSSGSFIDLGYLLQAMGGFKEYSVYGIFTLAHPGCGKPAPMANSYTALRELNHYLSDGVRYRQRVPLPAYFPDPIYPSPGTTPYRGTMLIMARTGSDSDIPPMHEAVGEFLYSSSCSNIADATFQKIVDPTAQYKNMRVKNMHVRFQTFGSAALVFPAAHIGRGAACRLLADALGEWLGKPALPVADGLALLNQMGFTRRGIRDGLLQPAPGKSSVVHAIEERIDAAELQIVDNNLDYRQTVDSQIEDGFNSAGVVDGSIGARIVPQTVKANKTPVAEKWLERLRKEIDEAVLDLGRIETQNQSTPDKGPQYAVGFCQAVLKRVGEIRAEISGTGAHQAIDHARQGVEEQWEELERANNKLAQMIRYAKGGREMVAPRWGEASKAYWHARLDAACYHETAEILGEIEMSVRRTLMRLQGSIAGDATGAENPNSLLRVAEEVRREAEAEFGRLDTRAPRINGHVVFEPESTILEEHRRAMAAVDETDTEGVVSIDPSRQNEDFARAWAIRSWPMLMKAGETDTEPSTYWLTTPSASPLDPPVNLQATATQAHMVEVQNQLDRAIAPLIRRFYAELNNRDVLKMVYGHADRPNAAAGGIVQAVVNAAAPFLDINDVNTPLGAPTPQDPRTPEFAFFLNAESQTPPYIHFRDALAAQHINNRIAAFDPTRAIVLRTRTTFSAGMIQGIQALADQERALRQHDGIQSASGRSPYESRKDVAWRTLDGSPLHPNIDQRIGYLLFGLAIGAVRPDGNELVVQTDHPARRLESDLERAGLVLCENLNLSAFLENALADWAQPYAAGELAAKIHAFVTQFQTRFPRLEYRGQTAESGELRDRVEDFLLLLMDQKASNALQAYDEYIEKYEPYPPTYHKVQGTTRPRDGAVLGEGYYCGNVDCMEWLRPMGEDELLPMSCPRCSATLFKLGWLRRWRKRKAKLGGVIDPVTPPVQVGYERPGGGYERPSGAGTPPPPPQPVTAAPLDDV